MVDKNLISSSFSPFNTSKNCHKCLLKTPVLIRVKNDAQWNQSQSKINFKACSNLFILFLISGLDYNIS